MASRCLASWHLRGITVFAALIAIAPVLLVQQTWPRQSGPQVGAMAGFPGSAQVNKLAEVTLTSPTHLDQTKTGFRRLMVIISMIALVSGQWVGRRVTVFA